MVAALFFQQVAVACLLFHAYAQLKHNCLQWRRSWPLLHCWCRDAAPCRLSCLFLGSSSCMRAQKLQVAAHTEPRCVGCICADITLPLLVSPLLRHPARLSITPGAQGWGHSLLCFWHQKAGNGTYSASVEAL